MAIKSRDKLAQKRSIKGYAKQAESNKLLESPILISSAIFT